MRGFEYQFPAYAKLDGVTLERQLEHIHEELCEADEADGADGVCAIIEELMDVIHCTETALRIAYEDYMAFVRSIGWFDPWTLDDFKAAVILKNERRGYYGEAEE